MKTNLVKKLALATLALAPATVQTTEARTNDALATDLLAVIAVASTSTAVALSVPHIKKAALDMYDWFFWPDHKYMSWLGFEITRLEQNYDFAGTNNYNDHILGQIATKSTHPQYGAYSYAERTLTPLICGLAFVEHDLALSKTIIKEMIKRNLICDPAFNKIVWWYQTLSNIKHTLKGSSRYQQEALQTEENKRKKEKLEIQREQLRLQREQLQLQRGQ